MRNRPTFVKRSLSAIAVASLILGLVVVTPAVVSAPAAQAAVGGPGSISVHVQSARSVNPASGFVHLGDPVTSYKWLINVDDTGNPGTLTQQGTQACLPATAGAAGSTNPDYADTCQWPSVRNTSGFAPIVAQGDQTDLNDTKTLDNLPAGKYLISVTADNFKIDGQHFTVDGGTQRVTVQMNPTPLPLSTMRIEVFNDNAPVDATYEVDAERGLAGFTAHLSDVLGTVSTDYYGNALCTKYMHRVGTTLFTDALKPNAPIAFDANNKPVVDPASTGKCTSDGTGLILIPNMGPNRLAATVTPPAPVAGQTYQWVQTTTLEGGHDHDIWSQEGSTGFDTEQTKGAELVPSVQFGFVKTQALKVPTGTLPTGEIKGVVIAALTYIGGQNGQLLAGETGIAGAKSGGPIKQPWVALSDLGAGDAQIYLGRGGVDGKFDIKNVPDGTYQVSIWDDDQNYILWSFNAEVSDGGITDVGNKPIVGWFTHIYGHVFIDANANGKQDPGEAGVPQFGLTVRERDNSLMDQATNSASTDGTGAFDIRQTYPLGKWLILEAFNTRYKTTGITYKGENESKYTTQLGSLVDLNFLPIIGLGGEINWGVQPYNSGTNGGIVGTVTYDTTRNELDPADAATEPYQPGIPNVPVNLFVPKPCAATTDVAKANECRQGYQIVPLQIPDPNWVAPITTTATTTTVTTTAVTTTAVTTTAVAVTDTSVIDTSPAASVIDTSPPGTAATTTAGTDTATTPTTTTTAATTTATATPVPVPVAPLITNPALDRGAFVKGPQVQDTYTSEKWDPPRGCTARQYNGVPLTDQQALPEFGPAANRLCVEAPMMGIAVGASDSTPGAGSQTVNGNYGFATSKINLYAPGNSKNPEPGHNLALYADLAINGYPEQALPAIDYIVSVDIPTDPVDGKPMYKVTSEADVNVFDGDSYLPQLNYPPATPALANNPADPPRGTPLPPTQPPSQQAGIISPCVGSLHSVHVTNGAFLAGGGSPFEGLDRPSCTDKLVTVRTGQATAPNFNLFTDVPIPTHFWGLTLNDLGLTLDKRSVNYGEAQGIPYVPVGLYDWAGRLVDTTHTDFNGLYEALEPSTGTFNCPVPAGPCPNMYRFVGNDPGQPGALNADYNPRFRTIATNFQAWPGLFTVTDEAPTQVASTVLAPDTTVANPTVCDLGPATPQLLAVDRPYVRKGTPADDRVVTITGFGFGTAKGALRLGSAVVPTASWSDKKIVFAVPATFASGPAALSITRADGLTSYNGLTIQVLASLAASTPGSTATNPKLAEVGATKEYKTIQAALEAARPTTAAPYWLVVVWPNTATMDNPQGEYSENVIVHHQVRIQGVGPGGFDADGTFVAGSIIDGSTFNPDNSTGAAWITLLGRLTYSGRRAVPDAAVVTILDDPAVGSIVPVAYPPTFDGFTVTGGSQSDVAVNVNALTGAATTPYGATGALITQGGGVYVHNNVRNLQLTDNIIRGNGGSYGGAVRVGTPYVGSNRNFNLLLARNQIRDNGGTNLAGGIGLFTGSDGYKVTGNAICGNFSAEYGGAITAFGYQVNPGGGNGGSITKNRIWFNASYDEGGGIMIAGELPAVPTALSAGTGPVTIDKNVIQANLASDDGGGIRLLQVSGSHVSSETPGAITITNNTIANNISAHEGGGLALDDAAFVNVVNNTVAKNLTTATAVTSNGQPAPAGLSTAANSDLLQARLRNTELFPGSVKLGTTVFSKPTLLNDVFWDNRAGTFGDGVVTGIGGTLPDGTPNTTANWDMGVADDPTALLTPTHTVLQDGTGVAADPTNRFTDPGFAAPYDVTVNILASRTNPAFRQSVIVAQILPPSLMGDYHLALAAPATPTTPAVPVSPASGLGAASVTVRWGTPTSGWTYPVAAPLSDIDGNVRPAGTAPNQRWDAGSDQMTP